MRRGFFVQGLFEVEIRGLNDIMAVVDEGNGNRKVSSHLLNKDSSRSHSLLTVYLDSEKKDPEDGHLVKQFGKVGVLATFGMFPAYRCTYITQQSRNDSSHLPRA